MSDAHGASLTQQPAAADAAPGPGFWIINVRVLDQVRYERYLEMAFDAIDGNGGDIIVRTSEGLVAAGNPKPRLVVVKFHSHAAAIEAFKSISQQAGMLMFDQIAEYDVLIVEGLTNPL